jgi:hypothetical protein
VDPAARRYRPEGASRVPSTRVAVSLEAMTFPPSLNDGNLTHRHDEAGTMREIWYRDGDIGVEA